MRSLRWAVALPVAAAGVALASAPASAQSFFEKLFGIGAAAPRAVQAPPVRPSVLRGPGGELPRFEHRRTTRDDDDDDDGRHGRRQSSNDGSGKVRTVCVRLCDGFYWPISNAISPRNLGRDAGKCRASCGEEAVLYHEPAPGGDTDKLVDGGGKPYTELRNAFLYRKTRVEGCSCKPEPWSDAALERHREYAAIEAERRAKLAAQMRPVYVAADMTPPAGGMALQPMQVVASGPVLYPADATPGEAVTVSIAALAAAAVMAEVAETAGTTEVVSGNAEPALASLEPAATVTPEQPVTDLPAKPAAPAPLFTAEPAAPLRGSGTPVIVAESKPVEPAPPSATPATLAPDDPIVAPRREPAAPAVVAKPLTDATRGVKREPMRESKPQHADRTERQPAKPKREVNPDVRKPPHRMAQAERSRQQPQRAVRERPAKIAAAAPSMFGKPKFTYPGDAPARYR